jgi:hypothetical protein
MQADTVSIVVLVAYTIIISLAVEFDIWYNADSTAQISTDIMHDHVSIHSAGRSAPNSWYVTLC